MMSLSSWIRAVALVAVLIGPSAFAQTTVRYTVLIAGNQSGFQTTTLGANGTRESHFEYNDRGRGPKLTSKIRLAADGTPVSIDTSGNDYLKAPVSETFAIANGTARWDNGAERDEQRLGGSKFYVSLHAMPEDLGLLANALLRAPGQTLPLLPAGEATVRRTGEAT